MRLARALLGVAVSAGLLAWVAARVDFPDLRDVDLRYLLAAAALGPAQVALGGWRWARVAARLGAALPAREAALETGLSTLLNQLLPGGIAGDVVRVARRAEAGALAAAVVDRAAGLASLAVTALVGLVVWSQVHGSLPAPLVAALAALFVGFGALWATPAAAAARDPGTVALSLLLTGSFLVGMALAGAAVGVPPGPWVLTGGPWLLLAMAVPLSFAGWGPREVAALWVWPLAGATDAEGVRVSAAYGVSVFLGAWPGGVAWLVARALRGGRGSPPPPASS